MKNAPTIQYDTASDSGGNRTHVVGSDRHSQMRISIDQLARAEFKIGVGFFFIEINGNLPYPPFNDRLHSLALCIQYEASKYWVLSANWIYASGAAISTPTGFYNYQGYQVPIYSSKNNDRLPAYHRMDVSAMLRLNPNHKGRFEHAMIFSVYNVYNRVNPISITFNKTKLDDQSLVVPMNALSNASLVPTALALAGFIPSFNYTLKF